jgi:hypothetical protein
MQHLRRGWRDCCDRPLLKSTPLPAKLMYMTCSRNAVVVKAAAPLVGNAAPDFKATAGGCCSPRGWACWAWLFGVMPSRTCIAL